MPLAHELMTPAMIEILDVAYVRSRPLPARHIEGRRARQAFYGTHWRAGVQPPADDIATAVRDLVQGRTRVGCVRCRRHVVCSTPRYLQWMLTGRCPLCP